MPITKVILLNVPFESDYKHTPYFASKSAQESWMKSKKIKEYTANFTYQRKDKIIRLPDIYDDIFQANYVMYQNTEYNNKWFYAFITKLEYMNDETTHAYIETDVIQTWFFDYTVQPSFIERQHVNNDAFGANTIPENLETGPYIINNKVVDTTMDEAMAELCYIMGSTVDPANTGDNAGSGVYNGIYSGVKYYRFDSRAAIDEALASLANAGKSDAITGLFMIPKTLAPYTPSVGRAVNETAAPVEWVIIVPGKSNIQGYTPKNKKLLTYPFNYMLVSNGQGGNAIYNFEDFNNYDITDGSESTTFHVFGALTPGGSIRLIPYNFKGATKNEEEGLNLGKFPACNFAVDMYTNWLTQNSVNYTTGIISAGASMIAGVAMMGTGVGALAGVPAIAGGITSIANTLGQVHQQSLVPPQARGNMNAGDVITAGGMNHFTFYQMSIKAEYARIIDKYFDMFGYKVNTVATPLKNHRASYWYTKTIDANIDGECPNDDLGKIKEAYDRGITFWKNTSNIGDYTLSNGII